MFNVQYVVPFAILLSVEWELGHSCDEEKVCSHFKFEWLVGHEIYGGVSCVGFLIETYGEGGVFSGY